MSVGDYNFIVTDLLSGNVLDVVEMGSFYWDEIYNAPGAGLGTARLDRPSTTEANFADWKNGFWVVKDGDIKWGGIVGKTQIRGGTKVLNVPVHGFMTYPNGRLIRNDDGMTYGSLERVSDIEWRDVDQFRIFKDIIDHLNSQTDGDIGLDVTWDTLSTVLLTVIYTTFSVKSAGEALLELASRLKGFSFRQVYAWVSDKPTVSFRLEYPSHKTVVDDILLYQPEYGNNIPSPRRSNILEYDDDGVDAFASGLAVIGGGEGNNQKLIYIQNTNGGAPLWETKLTFKDEFDEDILLERGKLSLDACSSVGDRNLTLTLDRELPPFQDDIYAGDTARVVINDQMKQEDDLYWVGRKRVTLEEDQNDVLTLEVTKRTLIRLIYGYGSEVDGGLDQTIFTVTDAGNSGTGTLRDALSTGSRYIQFDPSLEGSTIDLDTDIACDTLDNFTVNGAGRVTITGAKLHFTNCDNFELVDLKFESMDNEAVVIDSKTGLSYRDLHYRITGCDFTNIFGDYAIKTEENFGHNFYGTISYCYFDKLDDCILIDGNGANEGGVYYTTIHNCWFNDCVDNQPLMDNCNCHIFNCLFERYGDHNAGGSGITTRGDGQALVEYCYAIPRLINDIVGSTSTLVTTQNNNFSTPASGESSAIHSNVSNTLDGTATETNQNAGSIFTVPYNFYPDPAPNAELIRWEAGAKLNGPQSTDYTVWIAPTSTPLGLSGTSEWESANGEVTVANPSTGGDGNTSYCMLIMQGTTNAPTIDIAKPTAGAVEITALAVTTAQLRVRHYYFTNGGETDYTFGASNSSDNRCSAIIVALDGPASTVLASGTPVNDTGPVVSFPAISCAIDDLIIASVARQSFGITVGDPTNFTEIDNDTSESFITGAAWHDLAESTSVTPSDVTWSSSSGIKLQQSVGFRS